EVEGIAADLRHGAAGLQAEPVSAGDFQREIGLADILDPEAPVDEADERADGAGPVIVLAAPEQQGAAALEIPKIDVISQGRADEPPAGIDHQHDLRLGIAPERGGMHADARAMTEGRHGLGLGEDLRIGADADLEILRPEPAAEQHLLGLARWL